MDYTRVVELHQQLPPWVRIQLYAGLCVIYFGAMLVVGGIVDLILIASKLR